MDNMFDSNSTKSIISYAKELKGYSLREKCGKEIENHGYKGKGNFGQLVEKFYFGYEPNSKAEADFVEVGMELKSSPLKTLKNGKIRSIIWRFTKKNLRTVHFGRKMRIYCSFFIYMTKKKIYLITSLNLLMIGNILMKIY